MRGFLGGVVTGILVSGVGLGVLSVLTPTARAPEMAGTAPTAPDSNLITETGPLPSSGPSDPDIVEVSPSDPVAPVAVSDDSLALNRDGAVSIGAPEVSVEPSLPSLAEPDSRPTVPATPPRNASKLQNSATLPTASPDAVPEGPASVLFRPAHKAQAR